MTPFFVTGLPRSRTAWMANWLTTDRSLCYHDTPFNARLLLDDRFIGFSGPELACQYDGIVQQYPDSPWLVLVRPADDSLRSFRKWAGDKVKAPVNFLESEWLKRNNDLLKITQSPRTQTFEWTDVDDAVWALEMWNHLLPELKPDRQRWRLLCEWNIQQNLEKGLKRWQQARY